MKSILATLGIVAVVAGVAVWQFGFFSEKAQDVANQVKRSTASARVESAISTYRAKIDDLDGKARKYNVDARKLELAWERENEAVEQLKEAVVRLASAAKNAGLPKPSEALELTDEQRAVTLPFGNKTIAAPEIYTTLERWVDNLKTKETVANQKKDAVDRLRSVAEQLQAKKGAMTAELAKLEGRVKELEAARDVAKINAELATIEASVNGIEAGDSGKAMATIQDEIDELNALADVYQEESQVKTDALNPSDVLQPVDVTNELDAYWN